MKNRLFTLLAFMLTASFVFGQYTFDDDFESYTPGDFLAATSPNWSTWSGPTANQEDVQVTNGDAFSGENSIRFQAFGTNGPQDVILPFNGKYTTGDFVFSMMMKVQGGTGAYFNFQSELAVGQIWALDWTFASDGSFTIVKNPEGISYATGNYPQDVWMEVKVEGDLTNGVWTAFIDNVEVGSFSPLVNAVASLDLFPLANNTFFVDDVHFSHQPFMPFDLDLSITNVDLPGIKWPNNDVLLTGQVRNIGNFPINSYDLTWSNGIDDETISFSGLNIPTFGFHSFTHTEPITVLGGDNNILVTVSNINGGDDEDATNNSSVNTVIGAVPAPNRKVLIEEGTGTWCVWCPRGEVYQEEILARYPDYFIPIAVHNGDPMVDPNYDGQHGFTGYPSMSDERTENFVVPTNIDVLEERFLWRIIRTAPAVIQSTFTYDKETRVLNVTTEATAQEDFSGNYRLGVIVVEDNVTGTSNGYNQRNAYANGINGPMGGYENLPDPVPAAQMVYNHVGRMLIGGFSGQTGSLPASMTAGSTHTYDFAPVTIDSTWDSNNIHLVTVLLNPDGHIVNANTSESTVTSTKEVFANHLAKVAPNPFSDVTNVILTLEEKSNVEMVVYNSVGQVVAQRHYGELSGDQILPFNGANFAEGIYYIHIRLDNQLITKKVMLSK